MIKLGDKVRDIHSGFEGIAVAKTTFINGCVQYAIQPKCGKDNKILEDVGIDEQSLVVVGAKKKPVKKTSTGGRNSSSTKQRGY